MITSDHSESDAQVLRPDCVICATYLVMTNTITIATNTNTNDNNNDNDKTQRVKKGIGLAVVTAACTKLPRDYDRKKWLFIVGAPLVLTTIAYASGDRSKFQGYSTASDAPLSSWRYTTLQAINFHDFENAPGKYAFYIVRMTLSVLINVSSILLILIDAVCLEVRRERG